MPREYLPALRLGQILDHQAACRISGRNPPWPGHQKKAAGTHWIPAAWLLLLAGSVEFASHPAHVIIDDVGRSLDFASILFPLIVICPISGPTEFPRQ